MAYRSSSHEGNPASSVLSVVRADIRIVASFWGGTSAVGLLCLGLYCTRFGLPVFGALAEWALGVAMSSATLGFLFGIPKVLQNPRAPQSGPSPSPTASQADGSGDAYSYAQRVNTNLEEISDWLTKIIVGVGLVELKQLPVLLNGLADRIQDTAEPVAHGVALALIAFFGSTGFLFGYLLTRLYLQGALARADQHASQLSAKEFLRVADGVRAELQQAKASPLAGDEGAPNGLESLDALARQYLELDEPDPIRRLAKKDKLATELYSQALHAGVSRDELSQQSNEALILTLASLVHADPTMDDLPRLLNAGGRVGRLHVQYRVVMAIAEILRRRLALPAFREPTRQLLQRYLVRADSSLREAIEATTKLIDSY